MRRSPGPLYPMVAPGHLFKLLAVYGRINISPSWTGPWRMLHAPNPLRWTASGHPPRIPKSQISGHRRYRPYCLIGKLLNLPIPILLTKTWKDRVRHRGFGRCVFSASGKNRVIRESRIYGLFLRLFHAFALTMCGLPASAPASCNP